MTEPSPFALTTDVRDDPSLPSHVTVEPHTVHALDGKPSRGLLYRPQRARAVACIMHPREDLSQHYLIPHLLRAGYAVWAQNSRSVGNDLRLIHEELVLDVAAGITLAQDRTNAPAVLLGTSGGSGLYSLYVQQSSRSPEDRLATAPSGKLVDLREAELPNVDGVAYLAPHRGQGAILLHSIDPSIVDEDDPLSSEPALDMYNPDNGYSTAPTPSSYTAEFLQRFRDAQTRRVHRLDETAKALIRTRSEAKTRAKDSGSAKDRHQAWLEPIMTIWRTDADPRTVDPTIDPSDRTYGSIWGSRPERSNYGSIGFGRLVTPDAWLSTWSGLSSNATMAKTAPEVAVPCLVIEYTGDVATFPTDYDTIFESLGSDQKERVRIRADHRGNPIRPEDSSGRPAAAAHIVEWLNGLFT